MAAKIPMEGKARTVLIAALGVLVVGLGLGVWSWRRAADESQTPPPPSSTVGARAPVSDVGAKRQSSQVYDDLLREGNAKAAADASKTGGSAMPVIRPDVERPAVQVSTTTTPPPPTAKPVETQSSADDQAYRNAMAERERVIKERATAMTAQVQLLRKAWTVAGHTQMVAPEAPAGNGNAATAAVPNTGTASNASPRGSDRDTSVGMAWGSAMARAGDTAVAVLDSPINTDNPLPIYRATVVQDGPLHGAVLLGQIQSNGSNRWSSGVPLTFTQISLPGQGTQPVSAFAINAEDAGALKGEVNHHVWSRYAAAFGGAFLQGVGQGLLAGGRQQQVITSQTGYAVQSDAYTNKQLVLLGAANVGQMAATALQADVSRPPTISIPGGTTIAVFFTTDFPASSPK